MFNSLILFKNLMLKLNYLSCLYFDMKKTNIIINIYRLSRYYRLVNSAYSQKVFSRLYLILSILVKHLRKFKLAKSDLAKPHS